MLEERHSPRMSKFSNWPPLGQIDEVLVEFISLTMPKKSYF